MLLHEVIESALTELESAPAIVSADDRSSLSFGELNQSAQAFAMKLQNLGIKPGDRIAILAPKSPQIVACFLGASIVGALYVPIDEKASKSYWATVLADLGIKHVFSNIAGLAEKLRDVHVHDLDPAPPSDVVKQSVTQTKRTPDDAAYILATSGSTGRPKGVVLSHNNALAFVNWAANELALGPDDRVLSIAPFHFDLSVFDIYASLSRGARLVLAPSMATMFPGQLIETIEEHQISVLYTVPTILKMLLDSDAFKEGAGSSLRTIIYAGEPFPVRALSKLMHALPGVTFHNFFGPTETNVCLAHRFNAPPGTDQEISIGQPASDARITLVDEAGEKVEPGGIGEIVVDGPTCMKGYLKADGFHAAPKPLATGDFAQLGADGAFYFRGRRDSQVKVRGARVELTSVESALASVEGVTEAAALVIDHDLVGFIATESKIEEKSVRAFCAKSLPPGAVPHKVVVMAHLPRISNGKLDLLALKALV